MNTKHTHPKQKKSLIGLAILVIGISIFLLFPTKTNAQFTCPAQCLTNVLNIGTGYNHAANTYYSFGAYDEYWRITKAPNGYGLTSPICAVSHRDQWGTPAPLPGTTNNTHISISSGNNQLGNRVNGACNLYSGEQAYWYERSFCICTPDTSPVNIGINILYDGDINVSGVDLLGPMGFFTTISSGCQTYGTPSLINIPSMSLYAGVYTLRFVVLNDYANYPWWGPPPNGTSASNLAVSAVVYNVLITDQNIVDNQHFGKNAGICAPTYPPSPNFNLHGRHCMLDSADTAQIFILPFNNNPGENVYTVTGPLGTVPLDTSIGMFIANYGSYTVTATDQTGCSHDSVLRLYLNPPFTITPPIQCVDTSSQGLVVFHTDTLIVNYGFQINGGPPVGFIDSNIYLNPGTYTVTCVDPFHGYCTSVDTVKIGKIPILTASVTPACIGVNDSSLIWSMAFPVHNPARYLYEIFQPGNTLLDSITSVWIQDFTQVGLAGIYTVYVTDTIYGCKDTVTIDIGAKPVPGLVLTTTKGCLQPYPNNNTAVITATPTIAGTYLYQINGGPPQVSNQFTISDTGAYYVNVIGPNGCPSVPEKIDIGNCLHCNPTQMGLFQTMQWYTNDTSSIDMGIASPTYPIVIDGTLTVDDNFDIWNNPNVYFTYKATIQMVSNGVPIILDINNSTLKPCKWYWTGILADNVNENINIDSSTITGMTYIFGQNVYTGGVNLTNGALINATNSNFLSNHFGIIIKEVPFVYGGLIENNIFDTMPGAGTTANVTGVYIQNVKQMQVGGLVNINQGNTFRNIVNGINVQRTKNVTYSSTVGLYNNNFANMKFNYAVSPALNDSAIIALSGNFLGSAIYSEGWYDKLLTVNVDNTMADPPVRILNCDIGIASKNANMNISNCDIEITTLGIVSNSYGNVDYNIHDNLINKVHIGIGQYGNIASTQIQNNWINTRDTQMIATFTNAVTYKSPIGIDINHGLYEYDPTGGFYNNIANNHIDLKAKAGIGINNQNSDRHQQILDNTVYLSNNSADPITASDVYACFGIVNMNAKKTSLKANYMYGSPSLQGFNSRNRIGLLMSYSPNNILECNKVKYSRYGFYAWGDNTTSSGNVKFNKFNANAYPWYLLDFGSASPSTFGNVGSGISDNGNEFISISNPINWLNVGGLNPNLYKVFRNSFSQPNYRIYTDPAVLDVPESGASIVFNEYLVLTTANAPNDTLCVPDPMFIMGGGEDIDSSEFEQAMAIVQDSVEYINYQEVGRWFDKYRLYNSLDVDSLLRNSTPEMLYFYNQQQNGTLGSINDADKRINMLTDTSTNANNFESRYYDAVSINNTISSDDDWEMNEKYVNDLKLKIFSGNIDTIGYDTLYSDSLEVLSIPITSPISAEEKYFLRNLANTCPFIGGNAVYKARNLWSTFSPGNIYDDRLLCILGQNKNMDYTNLNIDSLYEVQNIENQKSQGMIIKHPINVSHNVLEDGEVMIFPNPASTQITVEYKCKSDGELIIFNCVGQQVLKAYLTNGNTKVSLLTKDLPKGVYSYKCIFAGCESKMGKLTIIK